MLDLTWKIFCMTGNVDSYLLLKELEGINGCEPENRAEAPAEVELDSPLH